MKYKDLKYKIKTRNI